ncbi:MAG: ATP synthase F1 subunit delta [Planctomycetota bacterium]
MPLIEAQPDALARVYANSLFDLAGSPEQAEEILGELEDLIELARADALFSEFLSSRVVPTEARDASLQEIFKGNISDITLRFLRLLNQKDRLSHLPAMVAALSERVQKALGRLEVDIYTATPLAGDDFASVRERVAEALGKNVVLHAYTDESMLGGVKFRVGDRLIDDSIATHLRRVKDRLADDGASNIRSKAKDIIDNA